MDKSAILYFDFDRLDISLGPLSFGFDLPANEERVGKKRPFFIWLHADEDIAIGRGRGGGIAVWGTSSYGGTGASGWRNDQQPKKERGL